MPTTPRTRAKKIPHAQGRPVAASQIATGTQTSAVPMPGMSAEEEHRRQLERVRNAENQQHDARQQGLHHRRQPDAEKHAARQSR